MTYQLADMPLNSRDRLRFHDGADAIRSPDGGRKLSVVSCRLSVGAQSDQPRNSSGWLVNRRWWICLLLVSLLLPVERIAAKDLPSIPAPQKADANVAQPTASEPVSPAEAAALPRPSGPAAE